MLNDETVSRRLRVMAGWVRGMRDGTEQNSERTADRLMDMLGDCAHEVEQMEIAAGSASVPSQLKAAGRNPVMMKAVLQQAMARKVARHG